MASQITYETRDSEEGEYRCSQLNSRKVNKGCSATILVFLRQYQLGQVLRVAEPRFNRYQPLSLFGETPLTRDVLLHLWPDRQVVCGVIRKSGGVKREGLQKMNGDEHDILCVHHQTTTYLFGLNLFNPDSLRIGKFMQTEM